MILKFFLQSVILPVYNSEKWLDDCLKSILGQQKYELSVEISIFLDSCTDRSEEIVQNFISQFKKNGFLITVNSEKNNKPKGGEKKRKPFDNY